MRILVVDDNEMARLLTCKRLKGLGHCEQAVDGPDALARIRRARAEKRPYRIVFMDIGLPEMDGTEVIRKIRESETRLAAAEQTRIVVHTIFQPEAVHVPQADAFLTKPITPTALFRALQELNLDFGG
jgi:two-component system chemotaxis response regulator CheY